MKYRAPQFNLALAGETFALVGQQDRAPLCQDCGQPRFLVSGRCEPCLDAKAQDLIESEAMQATFFGEGTPALRNEAPAAPRKRHSHRCRRCGGNAVACYKQHCQKPSKVDTCQWCR